MENNKNSNIVDLFLFQFLPANSEGKVRWSFRADCYRCWLGATLFALRIAIITLFTEQTANLTNAGREFMESRKGI